MSAFDQTTVSPLERPSTETLNRAQTTQRRTLSFLMEQQYGARTAIDNGRAALKTGFSGDGFAVRPLSPASLEVEITAGLGFYYDPTQPLVIAQDLIVGAYQGVSDLATHRPLVLEQSVFAPIAPPPAAGNSRYDIIEVKPKRELQDYETKLRYNMGSNSFQPMSAAEALRYNITQAEVGSVISPALSTQPISVKRGTPAVTGTQVEPTVTPGYVKIARILVKDTDTAINAVNITDRRARLFNGGGGFVAGTFTMRAVRNDYVRPVITHLIAPPGFRVVIFYRDKVPAVSGFPVSPNIMVFTGAPVSHFSGGSEIINTPVVMGVNEIPAITHGTSVEKNRFLQGVDIDYLELQDPNLAYPAGAFYAQGEYYSSLRPWLCAWNSGASLWNADMATYDPITMSFWMAFAY